MPRNANAYWLRTRRLVALLMLLGFGTTFATTFFARELAGLTLFGWPFPFYMAAQGLIFLYLFIVGVYALYMNHLDKTCEREAADGE
ncbi:DUF4212 domain-containing protein [Noviherbaspirillum massiliense]|uniref:DUF4212 domain-containing protein n=1 Tax=Noviherbaspirillum massiliense TaxID=1465823 RepID=UPI00054EB394|nr:sodium/substrate symporter small subunit [Noviherbaspirillum massiliense]